MTEALTPEEAGRMLLQGKVVAFPTETVYGLGAHALNQNAVEQIYKIKGRPKNNPLICHFDSPERVFQYVKKTPAAEKLSRYWPGPFSLVLPHEGKIPLFVTAGSELCACRIPDHPRALAMLASAGAPIAAPSANLSGMRSPVSAEMVLDQLGDSVDGILDGGRCRIGIESTVILIENEELIILRRGSLTEEFLSAEGFSVRTDPEYKKSSSGLLSPGLDKIHYRPALPLYLLAEELPPGRKTEPLKSGHPGMIAFGNAPLPEGFRRENSVNLSESGSLDEAAHNLYFMFDRIKDLGWDAAFIRPLPEKEAGRAVNERLARACLATVHYNGREFLKLI